MKGNLDEIRDAEGRAIAYLVGSEIAPASSTFVTAPDENMQVGFIVKAGNQHVPRHRHRPLERRIVGTCEVLVVRSGRCEVEVFDDDGSRLATRSASTGDVIVFLRGAHAIRILEPTTFLEVKQGPYPGLEEKETF